MNPQVIELTDDTLLLIMTKTLSITCKRYRQIWYNSIRSLHQPPIGIMISLLWNNLAI